MVTYHYNSAFSGMSREEIRQFCDLNEFQLIGSALFAKNESIVSKLVSWVCKGKAKDEKFIPSHVGSLILCGGHIYLFDMKPPKPTLTKFEDYLATTKDEYLLVMRNFGIDTEKFSLGILSRINQRYGYLSAIQSAFKFLWYPLREHCSEIHLKELQEQGLFTNENANETTPEDLKEILLAYKGDIPA